MKLKMAVVAMALACASTSWAQTDTLVGIRAGSIELGAAGGLSAPIGDYSDLTNLSWTAAFVLGYYPSPQFSFGIDIGGHWHGSSGSYVLPATQVQSSNSTPASFPLYRILTPYAKYQFKVARVSPYATGLAGLYLQEVNWIGSPQSVSKGYLGVAAGLGVQMVSDDNVLVFLEGRFHNAMRSDSAPIQFIDARVGLLFLL